MLYWRQEYSQGLLNAFLQSSNQGNQDSSGNQKNVIQGQRPDMENRHSRQRT